MGQKQSYDVNDNRHNTAADGEVAYEVDNRVRGQSVKAVEVRSEVHETAHDKEAKKHVEQTVVLEPTALAPDAEVEHVEVHEVHIADNPQEPAHTEHVLERIQPMTDEPLENRPHQVEMPA
ncbi:hypothetical protein AAVH_08795 [Aphelenchoides avenae]|nr:hypothetical protein AAVH_08795 [Aphelenchus avenae]